MTVLRLVTDIVDRQSAAEVEVLQGHPFGGQLGIESAGFADPGADLFDIRDLRAEMAVQQLQVVELAGGTQLVDQRYQLGGAQAEAAAITAGLGPESADLGRNLDPRADQWLDPKRRAALKNQRQLTR